MEIAELQEECRERGLGGLTVNEAVLRTRLNDWLRFSLDYKIPVPMLIVTRGLLITAQDGSSKRDNQVAERMRDFPSELVDEIKGKNYCCLKLLNKKIINNSKKIFIHRSFG
jgi:hypothetical protein